MSFSYSLTTYDRSQGKLRQRGGRGNSSVVGHLSLDSWSRLSNKKMPSRCGLVSFGRFLFNGLLTTKLDPVLDLPH